MMHANRSVSKPVTTLAELRAAAYERVIGVTLMTGVKQSSHRIFCRRGRSAACWLIDDPTGNRYLTDAQLARETAIPHAIRAGTLFLTPD